MTKKLSIEKVGDYSTLDRSKLMNSENDLKEMSCHESTSNCAEFLWKLMSMTIFRVFFHQVVKPKLHFYLKIYDYIWRFFIRRLVAFYLADNIRFIIAMLKAC